MPDSGALAAIVRSADVFVTSNLAPIRQKLRIEVEDVRAANPDIIYVRGTGWGNEGPMADVGGYDMACGWASSGMAFKMNKGGIEPLPQPPAFFDLQGANTIAGAIGFALFKRANTGETSVVDVSLMHVGMWALSPDITGAPYSGDVVGYGDRRQSPNPLVNGYATKDDRWVYFVCLQPDRFWEEFCTLLGRPDLITDERYVDSKARYENRVELVTSSTRSSTGSRWMRSGQSSRVQWCLGARLASVRAALASPGRGQRLSPSCDGPRRLGLPHRRGTGPLLWPHHRSSRTSPGTRPAHRRGPARVWFGLGGHRCAPRGRRPGLTPRSCRRTSGPPGRHRTRLRQRRHHIDQAPRQCGLGIDGAARQRQPGRPLTADARGKLTVPPAPGTRPRPISGSAICVSAAATTMSVNAASSIPDPNVVPWMYAVVGLARRATTRATLRSSRMRWAEAGSDRVPNSFRSPPAQKARPSPRSSTP